MKARHLGLNKLADKYAQEALEEQTHAERISKRLCELGLPLETQDGEWEISSPRNYPQEWPGTNAVAVQIWHWFAMDEAVEQAVISRLDEMLSFAEEVSSSDDGENDSSDSVSFTPRDKPTIMLLEDIWRDEAEHIAWAQQQMQLMTALGPQNYLTTVV